MSMLTVVPLLAVASLLPLAGLAAAQTLAPGSSWTLVDLPGQMLAGDRIPTLTVDGSRVQGSDGCNRYTAPYQAGNDGTFKVSGAVTRTRMACRGAAAMVARDFVAALTRASKLTLEGSRLTLLDGQGRILAVLEAQTQTLADTSWEITGYDNGRSALVSVLAGTTLTMAFSADGRVSGSAGCNTFTATYVVDAPQLSIRGAATTRKMCTDPAGVMEQETAFLQALSRGTAMRLDGPQLQLRDAAGALVVTATRRAPR